MKKIKASIAIKDDINFLEYPNWVIDEKTKMQSLVIEKDHGKYHITSPEGLPARFDKNVLYCLLNYLHETTRFKSYSITTTRYALAQLIYGKNFTKTERYPRIMLALKKWKFVGIHFEGVFFEGNTYTERYFTIIDDVVLNYKTKELYIKFNEQYIQQIRDSSYYKFIDLNKYNLLQFSTSVRLYELLVKSFKTSNMWTISIQNLAEKLTIKKRENSKKYYMADVAKLLKQALTEINKKTFLGVAYDMNKETGIVVFRKFNFTHTHDKKKMPIIIPFSSQNQDTQQRPQDITIKPALFKPFNKTFDIESAIRYFASLDPEEQAALRVEFTKNDFIDCLPSDELKIYSYLTHKKLWNEHE